MQRGTSVYSTTCDSQVPYLVVWRGCRGSLRARVWSGRRKGHRSIPVPANRRYCTWLRGVDAAILSVPERHCLHAEWGAGVFYYLRFAGTAQGMAVVVESNEIVRFGD